LLFISTENIKYDQDVAVKILEEQEFHAERFEEFLSEVPIPCLLKVNLTKTQKDQRIEKKRKFQHLFL
jgi:hypothetical protein